MKKLWLLLLLLLLIVADVFLGSVRLPAAEVWSALLSGESSDFVSKIIWNFRVPKMVTALLAGMALSVCGVQMQTLFRNPLADPYVLGISSGAGLGVAFFVMGTSALGTYTPFPWLSDLGTAAFAWIGALAVMLLIVAASKRLKSNMTLLVLGIMIGSAGSALIGLIQYFSDAPALKSYVLWTMGSLGNVTGNRLLIMSGLCLTGLLISVFNIKDLNVLLMGEQYARSLGIKLSWVRNKIFVATTLLAGSVTAFCGPIGFIGIAVPHISRMIFNNANHRIMIPASALTGSCMMILADIISQLPGSQSVLPVNTVAALMGIPVIIYVIFKNRAVEL
ncbi:MAG: iron ABC transporter permease [Bacteroidales bacterium]|nr:iron ABC transporter permease [Bacteroidales bacterium]MDD2263815.1 iron ABC transporter permease [Bacteroidales bacterium]MDD2830967.1 iron ABC transporter permease [Bacteroidales bacterium]MDD3208225.1 iron ABC transporter permease [Bacteroidales bacterium]MDD3696733.1 iron ABC transporter permease [Bacteroidales bacterium]